MNSRFQAATLVAAPSYPNAISWSDENLIAVASAHLVTILNPASPFGARGVITITTSNPFPIGMIERKDLFSGCLLPTCLSRDRRPCVRSIAWSPLGMAPNAGCLLAVCTVEGCVKLYRPPFCDFSAEWIEIMDISNKLYDYLASIKFGELDVPCSKCSDIPVKEDGIASDFQKKRTRDSKQRKREELNLMSFNNKGSEVSRNQPSYPQDNENCNFDPRPPDLVGLDSHMFNESCPNQSLAKIKKNHSGKIEESSVSLLISAQQYASCSAMLSSIVIAWSPVMQPPVKVHSHANSSVSVLAVGGKSGKVSFWKIDVPECHSVVECMVPTRAVLVGLLQAHKSWINCISWVLFDSASSNPKVLLATGSTDGSVRIWQCYCEDIIASSDSNFATFTLLKEVISGEAVPVTQIYFHVPDSSVHKLFLAVGKGSGSLEVRIFNISSCEFDNVGLYNAHDHVVTGLAWAFDGHYLYSCSEVLEFIGFLSSFSFLNMSQTFPTNQTYLSYRNLNRFNVTFHDRPLLQKDNVLRGWNLDGSSLCEVSISSHIPHLRSSIDLPDAFRSCFGLAVSPGNLMAAVVRNFDLESLDQMYQARTQKAAVEFFWIGGKDIEVMPIISTYFDTKKFPHFSEKGLVNWESNILWSLNQFKNTDKPIVVWDIGAALLAFKQSIPDYVEHILLKWLATSYIRFSEEFSAKKILFSVSENMSTFSTRQLHLLNIICRRVVLSEMMQDQTDNKLQNLEGLDETEDEQAIMWKELLLSSERELRQRLIGLSFICQAKLATLSATVRPGQWYPVGLVEMEQWVGNNHGHVQESLKVIASEAGIHHRSEYSETEQCTYCSASVPFESPEFGFCQGVKSHKLVRCSVSMQVCPSTPLWFCICCYRWAFRLAPKIFFQMSHTPDFSSMKLADLDSKPLCPFCGILLQRKQPDFLLSTSPV